jgi:hypothetical protein
MLTAMLQKYNIQVVGCRLPKAEQAPKLTPRCRRFLGAAQDCQLYALNVCRAPELPKLIC